MKCFLDFSKESWRLSNSTKKQYNFRERVSNSWESFSNFRSFFSLNICIFRLSYNELTRGMEDWGGQAIKGVRFTILKVDFHGFESRQSQKRLDSFQHALSPKLGPIPSFKELPQCDHCLCGLMSKPSNVLTLFKPYEDNISNI